MQIFKERNSMEIFGQYIFIILLIVIFLINALLASKRKTAKENNKPVVFTDNKDISEYDMDEWEKWFSEEGNDNTPSQQKITVAQKPVSIQQKQHVTSGNQFTTKETTIKKTSSSKATLKQKLRISLDSKEDAKRAILYSEIIKRKY